MQSVPNTKSWKNHAKWHHAAFAVKAAQRAISASVVSGCPVSVHHIKCNIDETTATSNNNNNNDDDKHHHKPTTTTTTTQ